MISAERSRIMRAVKGKNTGPEWVVRRLLHRAGYRYRLHKKGLPGKPDVSFSGRRKVIFIHGCFWHGHYCKRGSREPKSNVAYWRAKIARNRVRDGEHGRALEDAGWLTLVLWECELKDEARLLGVLKTFLGPSSPRSQKLKAKSS